MYFICRHPRRQNINPQEAQGIVAEQQAAEESTSVGQKNALVLNPGEPCSAVAFIEGPVTVEVVVVCGVDVDLALERARSCLVVKFGASILGHIAICCR